MGPPGSGSAASRYGPSSSFATRTSVASSSVNLRGSDRSPPIQAGAGTTSESAFFPGDPNDWSKEDDDYLHNWDPKDKRVGSISLRLTFLLSRVAVGGRAFTEYTKSKADTR